MTEELQQQEMATAADDGLDLSNVTPIFARNGGLPRQREAPVTEEEIAEYRRMKPLLLQMIRDWQKLRSDTGCPAMRNVLGID